MMLIKKMRRGLEKNCPDLGILLIRVGVGLIFLFAGLGKLMGIEGTIGFFTGLFGAALAPMLAWIVALTEFTGGLALLLGLFPRTYGVLLSMIMLTALISVQFPAMLGEMADGTPFYQAFRGISSGLLLLLSSLAIALLGPGRYSIEEYLKLKWKC